MKIPLTAAVVLSLTTCNTPIHAYPNSTMPPTTILMRISPTPLTMLPTSSTMPDTSSPYPTASMPAPTPVSTPSTISGKTPAPVLTSTHTGEGEAVARSGCTLSLTMPPSCTPYSATSPFNLSVAQQAPTVSPSSATWSAFYQKTYPNSMFQLQFGYKNQANQYQHPIYISDGSPDNSYNVSCSETWFTCPISHLHIPSYAVPAGGSDGHLGAIDLSEGSPSSGYIEMDMWQASALPKGGGAIKTSESGQLQTNSEGLGGAATGAGFALWAGVIRAPELASNTPTINHALFLVAPCTSNSTVYPSNYRSSSDSPCPNNQGAPYGAYGRLNMTPSQISDLPIAGADYKAILLALSQYGGYIGDTNGGSGFSIQVEADPTYSTQTSLYPSYAFDDTPCPSNGAPCTPLTAFENHWGNPDWVGDRYSINLSSYVNFSQYWKWLNPPTPQ